MSRTRNVLGQWWSVTDQGSEGTHGTALTTLFRYDAWGNPTLIRRTPSGGAAIDNTASYNVLGHKLSMTDPDRGSWQFRYNVAGELVTQTDAADNRTWFYYDLLGRVTERYEAVGTDQRPTDPAAQWSYASDCLSGATPMADELLLCESRKGSNSRKSFLYDAEGLPTSTTYTLSPAGESSKNFSVGQSYDGEGRPLRTTAPGNAGLITDVVYNSQGFAEKHKLVNAVGGASAGTFLHDINGIDAFGSITADVLGNGLDGTRTYSPYTGRILSVCVHVSAGCTTSTAGTVQAIAYTGSANGVALGYDEYDNLQGQHNVLQNVTEAFDYDRRQRLIHMNGRAYDPELGRFTGVDPFMQSPLNSQSLNPYSYVMNNPLAGTDPTGYVSQVADGGRSCGPFDLVVGCNLPFGQAGPDWKSKTRLGNGSDKKTSSKVEQQKPANEIGSTPKEQQSWEMTDEEIQQRTAEILQEGTPEYIGDTGPAKGIERAIMDLARGKISPAEFHERRMAGGTVAVVGAPIAAALAIAGPTTVLKEGGQILVEEVSGHDLPIPSTKNIVEGAGKKLIKHIPSLKEQAKALKHKLNADKNTVTIRTEQNKIHTHYDLDGATHKGVETPHKQFSDEHIDKNGVIRYNKDRSKDRVFEMDQQDIRTVRRYLERNQ